MFSHLFTIFEKAHAANIPELNNNQTVYNPNLPTNDGSLGLEHLLNKIISRFVDIQASSASGIVISILFAFAVLSVMYAGILYMTSRGSDAGPKKAKQIIINVVYGLVLLFLAAIIIELMISTAVWLQGRVS